MNGLSGMFSKQLRKGMLPALKMEGFAFDGSRTFRRQREPLVQIINLQLGIRGMQGKFTVNLAVYDPRWSDHPVDLAKVKDVDCPLEMRRRLGAVLPPRHGWLARLPMLGKYFGPGDVWWPIQGDKSLNLARDLILTYGIPWLESMSHSPPRGFAE